MIILAFVNAYLPGYKAGGPIQSVANLAEQLGNGFQLKIVTADRDFGDAQPYPAVTPGKWQQVGNASVLYLSPQERSVHNLRRIINDTEHDLLYLNSLFDPIFTLLPLVLVNTGLAHRTPVIVAPRGELSPGALRQKSLRKGLFLRTARRLYSKVLWQASTPEEEKEIRRCFKGHSIGTDAVVVAPDLPSRQVAAEENRIAEPKRPNHLRLLFASRISPKKNLIGALQSLDKLRGAIAFDICGPIDNPGYWATCQKVIEGLPSNVSVRYRGAMPHDELLREMAQHDLFFLPTLGENYGHAIIESLSAGTPVLISDQTPWRNLDSQRAGWALPLGQMDMFRNVLQRCVDMNDQEHRRWRDGAQRLSRTIVQDESILQRNRDLFVRATLRAAAYSRQSPGRPPESLAAQSEKHFENLAPVWERKYRPGGSLHRRALPFVRCLQESVEAHAHILDFGCGSGDIAIVCNQAGYQVSGVDLSPAMITRARARASGQGIDFDLLQDSEELNLLYPGGHFDGVIASSVLEYVPDPLGCLNELRRVCKPNGVLIATVPNMGHPQRWLEAVLRRLPLRGRFAASKRWRRYGEYLRISKNRFAPRAWLDLLLFGGWRLESVQARGTSLLMLVARNSDHRRTNAEASPVAASEMTEVRT